MTQKIEKKLEENIVEICGHTFTFTPSLRSLGVKYPNGRLDIIHIGVGNSRKQESERANEICMAILNKND